MKKQLSIVCIVIFGLFVFGQTGFAGDGRIIKVDDEGNGGYLVVDVRANKTVWVGCTVYPQGRGGYEQNLKPIEVKKGYGKAKFNVLPRMDFTKRRLDYVVVLWEKKISLRKCEKKYGKGSSDCRWARSMGYQMDGRLDRREGSYTPSLD